ncbi:MAG: YitT family protein [Bacteroidales bacterium]|jgi:uncharacterized membrane-anchored protein YitT (DUF2179 family)
MMKKNNLYLLKDYAVIILGAFIYSVAITQLIMPHKYVTGGLTGAAIVLNYATNIPVSSSILVFNVVLLIIGLKILGKQFLAKTIVGALSLAFFIGIFERFVNLNILMDEPVFAGILGAFIGGTGLGLVLSANGSTGGVDIIVMIINKYKNITLGKAMLFIDLMIVCSSYLVFQSLETIVYGIIILWITTYSVDVVVNGVRQSVQIFIFSPEYQKIATAINEELRRGCTVVDGIGWYSKSQQKIIIVMAKRTESVAIMRIIKNIDPKAFISQSTVTGIYGEGFDKIK